MGSTKNPKSFRSAAAGLPAFRSTDDLARHLGLSRWTVSRVINGHPGVHPETARRVREAMETYRFAPNPLARGLRRGRTSMIGVCLPDIEVFYLGQKLEFLRRCFEERGFQVMVGLRGSGPVEEARTLARFRELRVAGLVVMASRLLPESTALRHLAEAGIPVVMVDPLNAGFETALTVDRTLGTREALAHLAELGHRRVATLGLSGDGAYTSQRRRALDETAAARGIRVRHLSFTQEGSFYQSGRLAGQRLIKTLRRRTAARPTALMTINDRVAIGVMDALREHGISVPGDLSLVGYDNMEIAGFMTPRLTSIDAGPSRLIQDTTDALLRALEGGPPLPHEPLPTRLVVRESTARPRDPHAPP